MSERFPLVTLFEDEDEELLKQEFVRLMVRFGANYSPYEVAKYQFKDLREPELRAAQVATHWGSDLELLEQIQDQKLGKAPDGPRLDNREERLAIVQAIYMDITVPAKDRLKALELHAQIEGEIIKQVDKKIDQTNTNNIQLPVFQFAVRDD